MADAPDSCHSWVIVAACYIVYFMTFGITRIAGLLFAECITIYNVDREHASLPFVLAYISRCIAGPISGYLSHIFGFRPVISLGCLLSFLGVFTCYFAQDIRVIYAFWTVFGFGLGLATAILPQVNNLYFKKHASKAIGISLSGASIAGILLAPITVVMLQKYGLQGTFLSLSAIMLHTFPAAILLKNPNFKPLNGSSKKNCERQFFNEKTTAPKKENAPKDTANISLKRVTCSLEVCKDTRHCVHSRALDVPIVDGKFLLEHSKSTYDERKEITPADTEDLAFSQIIVNENVPCIGPDINAVPTKSNDILGNVQDLHKRTKGDETQICLPSGISKNIPFNKVNANSEATLEPRGDNFCQINEKIRRESHNTRNKPTGMSGEKKRNSLQMFSIFWDPVYLMIAFPRCYLTFLFSIVPTILVDFATDKGFSITQSTYFLIAYSCMDLFGKVCLGWITDGNYISRSRYATIFFSVQAFAFALMVWSRSFIIMMIAVVLFAIGIGATVPVLPGVLAQYIAKDKRAMAIASSDVLLLPLSFGTSPLIGYFRDDLGSYDGLMYIISIISLICSMSLLLLPSISSCRMSRKTDITEINS